MSEQRKECSTGGDRKYISLIHPIKLCGFYNRRRMTCIAADGSCGYQYQQVGQQVRSIELLRGSDHE